MGTGTLSTESEAASCGGDDVTNSVDEFSTSYGVGKLQKHGIPEGEWTWSSAVSGSRARGTGGSTATSLDHAQIPHDFFKFPVDIMGTWVFRPRRIDSVGGLAHGLSMLSLDIRDPTCLDGSAMTLPVDLLHLPITRILRPAARRFAGWYGFLVRALGACTRRWLHGPKAGRRPGLASDMPGRWEATICTLGRRAS